MDKLKESVFQYSSPQIYQLLFELNPDYDFNSEEMLANATFEVDIDEVDKKNNTAFVGLNISINDRNIHTENEISKSPFFCNLSIYDCFKWIDLDDNEIEAMLNVNAPSLLLSYARPIISTVISASPLPNYNIPLVNFQEMWEEKQGKDELKTE